MYNNETGRIAGTYRAPDGTASGRLVTGAVLWSGVIRIGYDDHYVDVIREDGNEVLASGVTFYGWKHRRDVHATGDTVDE